MKSRRSNSLRSVFLPPAFLSPIRDSNMVRTIYNCKRHARVQQKWLTMDTVTHARYVKGLPCFCMYYRRAILTCIFFQNTINVFVIYPKNQLLVLQCTCKIKKKKYKKIDWYMHKAILNAETMPRCYSTNKYIKSNFLKLSGKIISKFISIQILIFFFFYFSFILSYQ